MQLTAALQSSGALATDGRVVFLSSINGIAGAAGQTNYGASKAGLLGLARRMGDAASAAASSSVPRGTVNAVAPGFIETDMTAAVPLLVSPPAPWASSSDASCLTACALPLVFFDIHSFVKRVAA